MRYLRWIICCLLVGTNTQAQNVLPPVSIKDMPMTKLRIDPTYARGGRASQVFDTVVFTPLETRKDVVVGFTHNLQISKNYFVFFDQDLKGLYVFYKNGKYKASVTKLPLANWNKQDDGYLFQDFYLDKKTERIFVLYNDRSKENAKWLAVFFPEGQLLKSKKLPPIMRDMSMRILQIDSVGEHSLAIAHYTNPQEKSDSVLSRYQFYMVKGFDSLQSAMLPMSNNDIFAKSEQWIRNYSPSHMDNGVVIWSRNFDYSTFRTDAKGNIMKYQFLLPLSMSIDSSFYKDTTLLRSWNKAFAYFEGKNKEVQAFSSIAETNNWLVFQLQTRTWPQQTIMYNVKNQHLFDFNKVSSDSSSYFLPLKSWRMDAVDDGSIYNLIPAYEMFQAKAGREDAPWDVNPILKEYFLKENRKSNPVIVQLKIKSTL